MRRIGRAAAIAANEQFVSSTQTLFDQIGGLLHLRIKLDKRLQRLLCRGNCAVQDFRHRHG
jgi:hypothetical protein